MVKYSELVREEYSHYLNDESGIVKNGYAEKIYFPANEEELVNILLQASENGMPVSISGGGTGLAGGRVPLSGWIIATDQMRTLTQIENADNWVDHESLIEYEIKLDKINDTSAFLTVPVSITLKSIQNLVKEKGWFYPPDPTERSAFIGGNVSTNASGARSFKFGATREWVQEIRVVLMTGEVLVLSREDEVIGNSNSFGIKINGKLVDIPRPLYQLPDVRKNVAGPVITDKSQLMDLFIGSGGIFGVITQITLKLIRPPKQILSIFTICYNLDQAIKLVELCQKHRAENRFPIPMAVEYLDKRAISIINQKNSVISPKAAALVIIEQDVNDDFDEMLERWFHIIEKFGIDDAMVAQTHKEIEKFKEFRHAVPEYVNALVRKHGQSKIGTDFSVPQQYLRELIEFAIIIGEKFENFQKTQSSLGNNFGYALWAHAGDAHAHLNLIPRSQEESMYGKKVILEFIHFVINLGGSIAAEHGLGKKKFNGKYALTFQIDEEGINQIREIKKILDPKILLNQENLLGE